MAAYDRMDEEPPLDPAAERLRRKMARLLLISGGIMVLGFIAVFAALVYKLGLLGEADGARREAGPSMESRVPIPAGARLVSAELEGNRALLRIEAADGLTSLVFIDLRSGAVLGRVVLQPE
jgi:hypothetical protein